MANLIAAGESFVGSYSSVYRGRGWSKPTRMIEVTLGEHRKWNGREGRYDDGETYEFTFKSVDDARLVANAILAEVRQCKAAMK
jgi:hypothetical protein